jgi:hypothetical protein
MSATPPAPSNRPRIVDAAFWCWLAAAVLTAVLGLLMVTQATANTPLFFRLAGALLVVVGLAQGFLAGRARKRQLRFASAGVGLAMSSVAFLAVLLLFGSSILGIVVVAVIMILMITGSVLIQRGSAQEWFEAVE